MLRNCPQSWYTKLILLWYARWIRTRRPAVKVNGDSPGEPRRSRKRVFGGLLLSPRSCPSRSANASQFSTNMPSMSDGDLASVQKHSPRHLRFPDHSRLGSRSANLYALEAIRTRSFPGRRSCAAKCLLRAPRQVDRREVTSYFAASRTSI